MRKLKQNPFPGEIELTGHQFLSASCRESASVGLKDGSLELRVGVISVPTIGSPLEFALHYRPGNNEVTAELGHRWRHNYQIHLDVATEAVFVDARGEEFTFEEVSPNVWHQKTTTIPLVLFPSGTHNFVRTEDPKLFTTLIEDNTANEWRLEFLDGMTYIFPFKTGTRQLLGKIKDQNGYVTTFTYNGSDQLTTVTEPTGRTLTFTYSAGKLATVTDPRGNPTAFTFVDGHLTDIVGPLALLEEDGCSLSYTWDTAAHLITRRTDPNGSNLYFEYEEDGDHRLVVARDHEHASPSTTYIDYLYDTITECTTEQHTVGTDGYSELKRTTVRLVEEGDVVRKWDVRFDNAGNVWRIIETQTPDPDPETNATESGRHTRCFWSDQGQLLSVARGYAPYNATSGSTSPVYSRDNLQNSFARSGYDEEGNQFLSMDPNGRIDYFDFTVDGVLQGDQLVRAIYPGIAHFGVQGEWADHFGRDAWLLCAFDHDNDESGDRTYNIDDTTPLSYVKSITKDVSGGFERYCTRTSSPSTLIYDPANPTAPGSLEKMAGFWEPEDSSLDFTFFVNLHEAHSFYLSLYTHEGDKISLSGLPYTRYTLTGRDFEYEVTDLDGTRSFRLLNNAGGVWTTFAVRGDDTTPITVTVKGNYAAKPRLSAIAFDTDIDYDPLVDETFKPRREAHLSYAGRNLTQIVDGLGNTTAFDYYNDPDYPGTNATPDPTTKHGRLKKITDAYLKDTLLDYTDTYRNLTSIVDALSNETLLTYDLNGNTVSIENALSHVTSMTYNEENRLTAIEDALGKTVSLVYDKSGNLIQTTDQKGRLVTMTYTTMNRLESIVVDADPTTGLKLTTTFEWDAWGNLASITDPRDNQTRFEHDEFHQVTRVHLPDPDDEQQYRMVYDALGRLAATTTPNGTPNGTSYDIADVALASDSLRNLIYNPGGEMAHPESNNSAAGWYNQGGRYNGITPKSGAYALQAPTTQPIKIPQGMPLLAHGWAYRTGAISGEATMLLEFVDLDGFSDSTSCFLKDPLTSVSTWTELGPGEMRPPGTMQDRMVHLRLTPSLFCDDLELKALGTGFVYDPAGNLAEVEQPDGTVWKRFYDRFGRLCKIVDTKGHSVLLEYDVLDRVRRITDSLKGTYEFFYRRTGQLERFIEPGGAATTYDYDDVGRLTEITYPDNTSEVYSWNEVGNLETYTDNSGREFSFSYDDVERLTKIDYLSLTPAQSVSFDLDDAGLLESITERNGDQTTFVRDGADRITSEEFTPGSGSPSQGWKHFMSYDEASNRTALTSGGMARYGSARYGTGRYGETFWQVPDAGYDQNNRLVEFKNGHGDSTLFNYDREGRRTQIIAPNGVEGTATYSFLGHLLSLEYQLDAQDILKLAYGYDSNSNRTWMAANADTFRYVLDENQRLVRECLNCFSWRTQAEFQTGTLDAADSASNPGRVELLAWSDSFAGTDLNADRWRVVFPDRKIASAGGINEQGGNGETRGIAVNQNDGLQLALVRGLTSDYTGDNSNRSRTLPVPPRFDQISGSPGPQAGVEHRLPLTGDFDFSVELDQLQMASDPSYFGMRVSDQPLEINPDTTPLPISWVDVALKYTASNGLQWRSRHFKSGVVNDTATASVNGTPLKMRIRRTGNVLEVFYADATGSGAYQALGYTSSITGFPSTLYISLFVQQRNPPMSCIRFKNFTRLDSTQYAHVGTWTSPVYDSGRAGTAWGQISWTENKPTDTDVEFQIALSASRNGPWTYQGPLGSTSNRFTTPGGESILDSGSSPRTGQFVRVKAFLTSDLSSPFVPTATPNFGNLRVTYTGGSGANAWSEQIYEYDSCGNMTSKTTYNASGTSTDLRNFVVGTVTNASSTVSSVSSADLAVLAVGDAIVHPAFPAGTTVSSKGASSFVVSKNAIASTSGAVIPFINRLNQLTKQVVTPAGGSATTWTFSYDANGRMTGKTDGTSTWTYTWDPDEPRLIRVQGPGGIDVTYSYDSAGRMLTRDDGTDFTTFEWDGWTCVKETTGETVTRYIAPQGELHSFERGGQVYQVHADGHNGSVRAITDSTGAVVAHYEYDAWGNMLGSSSAFSGGFAYGFCGAVGLRADEMTGLVYARNRWFSPALGRFLSRDELESPNRYEYCYNDPVNWVDMDGLAPYTGGYEITTNPGGYPGDEMAGPDHQAYRDNELGKRKNFAKNTNCCKFAKQFGLNPAAICAVQYHEFSFFNPVSAAEMIIVRDGSGKNQIGSTVGLFGLAPSDVKQLVKNAPKKSGTPEIAATIQSLYGNLSIRETRMMMIDPLRSSQYFSAWFSQNMKPGLTPMQQAQAIKDRLNKGEHWRAKVIGYNSRWERWKEDLVSSFGDICEEECGK